MSYTVYPLGYETKYRRVARYTHQYYVDKALNHLKGKRNTPKDQYIQYHELDTEGVITHDKLFDQRATDQLIGISLSRESLRDALTQVILAAAHTDEYVNTIGDLLYSLEEFDQLDGISLKRVDINRYVLKIITELR